MTHGSSWAAYLKLGRRKWVRCQIELTVDSRKDQAQILILTVSMTRQINSNSLSLSFFFWKWRFWADPPWGDCFSISSLIGGMISQRGGRLVKYVQRVFEAVILPGGLNTEPTPPEPSLSSSLHSRVGGWRASQGNSALCIVPGSWQSLQTQRTMV